MKIGIVGHGPMMLIGQAGIEIDQCDLVVRLKHCEHTLERPLEYGTKTSVVAGSWNIAPGLKGIGGAQQYWVLLDSRHPDPSQSQLEAMRRHFEPWPCTILPEQCREWDQLYRQLRDKMEIDRQMVRGKHSGLGRLGHNHMSQGTKALLYAQHLYPDAEIVLFGFDNVVTGEFTWSVTRGPHYNQYPDHNWAAEHKLVTQMFDGKKLTIWIP